MFHNRTETFKFNFNNFNLSRGPYQGKEHTFLYYLQVNKMKKKLY